MLTCKDNSNDDTAIDTAIRTSSKESGICMFKAQGVSPETCEQLIELLQAGSKSLTGDTKQLQHTELDGRSLILFENRKGND